MKGRGMGRLRYYHYHRWGPARRSVTPLLLLIVFLLLGTVVLASASVVAVALLTTVTILVALGPPMLIAVAAFTVMRHLHRRRRHQVSPGQPAAMSTSGTPREAPVIPDWRATRARFAQLRSEYGQFECDPLAVLRLPALTDVTVASTSRFVDAFAEAQALDTDTEPPSAHRARFATAVDQAWRAWHAARDAAERIHLRGIPEQERATVQRAIKLLTMARDSDHDAERLAAYAKARAELAKLERTGTLRLPPAAAAALDVAARGQLPRGRTAS